jgi:hypothetical protein
MCNCAERASTIFNAFFDGINSWHLKRLQRQWALEDAKPAEAAYALPKEILMGELIAIEEDDMPKCDPTIKHMIEVGRAYLLANPGKPATAYEVKQIMALAEPQHNALQQSKAICSLLIEFSGKK